MNKNIPALAAGLMMACAVPALAGTATGTLTVKAIVQAACTVNTDSSGATTNAVVDFGTLSSLAANADASTKTSGGTQAGVLCSNKTAWALTADGGQNAGSGSQRYMKGGSNNDTLNYNLYSDSARSTLIAINGTVASGAGTGVKQAVDIYGRIPAGSVLPSPGNYLDTVTLTVTY